MFLFPFVVFFLGALHRVASAGNGVGAQPQPVFAAPSPGFRLAAGPRRRNKALAKGIWVTWLLAATSATPVKPATHPVATRGTWPFLYGSPRLWSDHKGLCRVNAGSAPLTGMRSCRAFYSVIILPGATQSQPECCRTSSMSFVQRVGLVSVLCRVLMFGCVSAIVSSGLRGTYPCASPWQRATRHRIQGHRTRHRLLSRS